MKRMLKAMVSLLLVLVMSFCSGIYAFAGEYKVVNIGDNTSDINYDPGLSGYEYVPKYKENKEIVEWSHVAKNMAKGTEDKLTYKVSRTLSTSLSSSIESVVDGMIAQAGVGFEIKIGQSSKKSVNRTFSIPYGEYECQYGSRWIYVYGQQKKWVKGVVKEVKNVSGKWTKQGFSNKVKIA